MPLPGSSTVLLPLAVRVVVLLLLFHIWVVVVTSPAPIILPKELLGSLGRFVVTHVLVHVVVVCLNATTTTIHVSL